MSCHYVYQDLDSKEEKHFYGYPFSCRNPGSSPCTYKMQIDNLYYCNHPNSRSYQCGEAARGRKGRVESEG